MVRCRKQEREPPDANWPMIVQTFAVAFTIIMGPVRWPPLSRQNLCVVEKSGMGNQGVGDRGPSREGHV